MSEERFLACPWNTYRRLDRSVSLQFQAAGSTRSADYTTTSSLRGIKYGEERSFVFPIFLLVIRERIVVGMERNVPVTSRKRVYS